RVVLSLAAKLRQAPALAMLPRPCGKRSSHATKTSEFCTARWLFLTALHAFPVSVAGVQRACFCPWRSSRWRWRREDQAAHRGRVPCPRAYAAPPSFSAIPAASCSGPEEQRPRVLLCGELSCAGDVRSVAQYPWRVWLPTKKGP